MDFVIKNSEFGDIYKKIASGKRVNEDVALRLFKPTI
jgi:hypothetical protein